MHSARNIEGRSLQLAWLWLATGGAGCCVEPPAEGADRGVVLVLVLVLVLMLVLVLVLELVLPLWIRPCADINEHTPSSGSRGICKRRSSPGQH